MDNLNIFDAQTAIEDQPADKPSFLQRLSFKFTSATVTEIDIDNEPILYFGY